MLLPSHRHTKADLELWAELEQADLLHFEQLQSKNIKSPMTKIEKSREVIRKFASEGECYASVSWGKDSTIIAHLIAMCRLEIPLGNVAQDGTGTDPHIADVRDVFLSQFPIEYYEECVPLKFIPDDGSHSPSLDIGISHLIKHFGTERYIGGVRASESGVRKLGMRTRGLVTANTCQPLGWWTTADVFAYLAGHNLPVHPNYAMLGGGRWSREHIRVSTIGGPKGNQFGRTEWEKEYYGDVLRRSPLPVRIDIPEFLAAIADDRRQLQADHGEQFVGYVGNSPPVCSAARRPLTMLSSVAPPAHTLSSGR